jgi:biopolymer transport protein ExbB
LGLLGTVVGMIRMFLEILQKGIGDANQLAGGIGQALICTAGGLCLAIPALMFHRYLRGCITDYVIEMEQQAMQLLDTLDEQPMNPQSVAPEVEPESDLLPVPNPAAPRGRRSAG